MIGRWDLLQKEAVWDRAEADFAFAHGLLNILEKIGQKVGGRAGFRMSTGVSSYEYRWT